MIGIEGDYVVLHSCKKLATGRVRRTDLALRKVLRAAEDCRAGVSPPIKAITVPGEFLGNGAEWLSYEFTAWVWITGDVKISCQFIPWSEVAALKATLK